MLTPSGDRCRARVSAEAAAALPGARGAQELAAIVERTWASVAEELAQRADGAPRPACVPGCACCCHLNVGTLPPEGAAIAAWLRRRLDDGARSRLAARLLAFHAQVRWLEDRERFADRLACPLLDEDGRCSIHPVRPLACRSVTSANAGECRRAAEAFAAGDEAPLVRMDLLNKELHDAARAGLADALAARRLDARCRDVSGMVGAFLADPALATAFLDGQRVPLE